MIWKSYKIKKRLLRTDGNIFTPAYEVDGCPAVDYHMWGVDFDERPESILALIHYRKWDGLGPLGLTRAKIKVHLTSDNLKLHGGHITFWITTIPSQRWHYTIPIPLNEPIMIDCIKNTWRSSWVKTALLPVHQSLSDVHSFGFAFVGFKKMPKGELILKDFSGVTN